LVLLYGEKWLESERFLAVIYEAYEVSNFDWIGKVLFSQGRPQPATAKFIFKIKIPLDIDQSFRTLFEPWFAVRNIDLRFMILLSDVALPR
jgi:hypothetical protein